MKRRLIAFILLLLIPTGMSLNGQERVSRQSLAGSWLGKINAGGVSLRIIFNLSFVGNDSLTATMDSPDQGVKNIKLGVVTLEEERLKISAGLMLAEYNGTVRSDTLIEGTWKQAGNEFRLDLSRMKTAFTINRPQEPKPPFPYREEEVTFTNDRQHFTLSGTLTLPEGDGPFPAVVLITGSGAQNRDEELMGHKPFHVIADHLARNGIAVLRYDDRGVGKSGGNYLKATSADLALDALAAFTFLHSHPLTDNKRTGLAGHSEGGLLAAMVASENPAVGFVISLAGPGVNGEEILHRQNEDISRLSGMDENVIREGVETNRRLFGVLKKETDNLKAEEKITSLYRKILIRQKKSPEVIEASLKQLRAGLNPSGYDWLRYFMLTDPADFWKRVGCPVLALNGDKDLQVAPELNLKAIEKAVRAGGNTVITTISLPGLNHLFQHAGTGLPSEYGEIAETFSPGVLEIINDWIRNLPVSPPVY